MTDSEQTNNLPASLKERKRIQVVVAGKFKVMHRPESTFEEARTRLVKQGLVVHETPHFLYAVEPEKQFIMLVHRLSAHEVDNNIGYYLMQELGPHGFITSEKDFGSALVAIVISLSPHHPVDVWNLYLLNTMQRLREKLHDFSPSTGDEDFITPFAHIYGRLLQLMVGTSLLDVGCACAFWPVLAAQNAQNADARIVGIDNRHDAIALSNNLAAATNTTRIEFRHIDLMTHEFVHLGTFDTVTAIALLEHLSESEMPQAFEHLLSVTRHRLIVSVPYEKQATLAYGHQQVFTPEKLEQWGKWCVETLQGQGRYWIEDCAGGLLIVERQ